MDKKTAKAIDCLTPFDGCQLRYRGPRRGKATAAWGTHFFAPPASDPQEECQIPAAPQQPLRAVRQALKKRTV